MATKPRKYSSLVRANNYQPTQMTLATLNKLAEKGLPRKRIPSDEGPSSLLSSKSYFHDLTSPDYSWLLPGWIAEERVVPNGRLYKYYYDPTGRQYKFKSEVIEQLEKIGLIVLDH